MSSPNVKLEDQSLDQSKVTELKEDLESRQLPVMDLKEDWFKCLDESLLVEIENVTEKADSCLINTGQSELPPEQETVRILESERAEDPQIIVVSTIEKVSGDTVEEIAAVDANLVHEANAAGLVGIMEASLQDSETQHEVIEIKGKTENGPKSERTDSNDQLMKYKVSVASPDLGLLEKSNTSSTESVSIIEKTELTLDFSIDKVNLELDVKHEMEQQIHCSAVPGGGELHPMDVEEPSDKKDIEESIGNDVDSVNSKNLGPHEKVKLEENSGDDSMGEVVVDNKKVDDESNLNELEGNVETSDLHKEVTFDIVGHEKPAFLKGPDGDKEAVLGTEHVKRKFNDQEGTANNDAPKRPRGLNLEGSKVSDSEPPIGNKPTFKRVPGNKPAVNVEAPKERHVPISARPPTSSLRIDRFVRPLTLKAVQELLGKTGTVTDFWMDQIKTHCYVSYSSIEEAIETRNAVYNLQWPTNGGRLLVAEFVDPQEVKSHLHAPTSTPSSATPQPQQSQPFMRQQFPKSHLPPPVKERLSLAPLPLVSEKVGPPVVTLDDLFQKTKATPRIYYLPLSDKEVAGKLESQGK